MSSPTCSPLDQQGITIFPYVFKQFEKHLVVKFNSKVILNFSTKVKICSWVGTYSKEKMYIKKNFIVGKIKKKCN